VAAQPVPYRTTEAQPTFEALKIGEQLGFPIALEPFQLTRFEMTDFALSAEEMGLNYIGYVVEVRLTTSGPWPKLWTKPCPPANIRRPWNCTRC
jgi:hypothetical protein